jgi:hypothetical protein
MVCFLSFNEAAEAGFGDFRIEFLGEFAALCKTALARESGPWGGV